MSFSDLSERDSVLNAIREFDDLGRERFLAKYGFRPAHTYHLQLEGRAYDSKAIVGAAHGYEFPDQGPLAPRDFSGGDATVRRKLEELGFTVTTDVEPNGNDAWREGIAEMSDLRGTPDFDVQERDYKLVIAEQLRAAATASLDDTAAWDSQFASAFGGKNNLTNWRNHSELLSQLEGLGGGDLRNAIQGCFDQNTDPLLRFEQFADATDGNLAPAALIELGSVILFSAQPDLLPPIRQSVFENAIARTEGETGTKLPVAERYGHYLSFARECQERLVEAEVPIRDMLDVQSLLWMLYRRPEGKALISGPRVWVEKTNVRGRPDRQDGEYAVGRALWSPAQSKSDVDIYRFMREIAEGDVVLHLTDGVGFTSASHAGGRYVEFDGVPDTEWGKQPSYLIHLEDHTPIDPPLARDLFLTGEFGQRLVDLLDENRPLFYNREPTLNQGAYLTPLPPPVLAVLNDAYESNTGRPIVDLTGEASAEEQGDEAIGPSQPQVAPTARAISRWLATRGLKYSAQSVALFLTALQTKGFVILSGVSGTGKTKLAQEITDLMLGEMSDHQVFLPVRPDWRDSRGLIGYFNPLSERYESTPLVRMLLRSRRLGGTSLAARVEQGLIERRDWVDAVGSIVERFEGRTEFSDDDLQLLWNEQANGIASAGQAPPLQASPAVLREITQALSDGEASVGERLVEALDSFVAAGEKKMPLLRTLRVLAVFEPVRVTAAADAGRTWKLARDLFDYKGPGLRHLSKTKEPDRIDEFFDALESGVARFVKPNATKAERAVAAWLLITLMEEPEAAEVSDDHPYFLILDEMNLARVEYYFADFLSVLESGRDPSTGLTREALLLHDRGEEAVVDPLGVRIPSALHVAPSFYVTGTINVDETTHALSPKVLDRAFTLEIGDVNFAGASEPGPRPDGDALLKAFTRDGRFAALDRDLIKRVASDPGEYTRWLQWLSDALRPHDLHFAYRSYDEIMSFVGNASGAPWFDGFDSELDAAFDAACLAKILPRFNGVRARIRDPLLTVAAWALNPESPDLEVVGTVLSGEEGDRVARLPLLYEKALRMVRRADTVGFASYA